MAKREQSIWKRVSAYLLLAFMVFAGLVLLCLIPAAKRYLGDLFRPAPPPLRYSVDGSSKQLSHTRVVPTLDTPIEAGTNTIWCASFLAAWQQLQKGGIHPLLGAAEGSALARLAAAPDPLPDLPEGSCYAVAGSVGDGILQTIRTQMRARFPTVPAPTFDVGGPDWRIAYAYLQTETKFTLPYFENRQPLQFTDSAGQAIPIRSFGIRREDEYTHYDLRKQVGVLYGPMGLGMTPESDFALDLCRTSASTQIVVARIKTPRTLAEAIDAVEASAAATQAQIRKQEGFGPNDSLLVPDMLWRISHRFSELESEPIHLAQQDIAFRLDRSGAELRLEAKVIMCPVASHFALDRPFLLYLKQRTAARPFFAMWIDNAELLQKW